MIIEGEYNEKKYPIEDIKKDYENGCIRKELQKKYDIGETRLNNMIRKFNINKDSNRYIRTKKWEKPYIRYMYLRENEKYSIVKTINNHNIYFGTFDYDTAKFVCEKLQKNGWIKSDVEKYVEEYNSL